MKTLMKKKYIAVIATTLIVLFSTGFSQAQEQETKDITIGVLAHEGKLEARKQWRSTAAYLTSALNRNFTVLPLGFKEVFSAVQDEKVDFFIVNPFVFVTAMVKYDAVPVATMKATGNDRFGGVIFTAASNINMASASKQLYFCTSFC